MVFLARFKQEHLRTETDAFNPGHPDHLVANILTYDHPHLHSHVYSEFRNLTKPNKQTMPVCKV